MTTILVDIFKYSEDAIMPSYATEGSVGCDLYSAVNETIAPSEYKLISTGIGIQLQHAFEAQIRPRSGLALKNGITVLNAPGTIDSDYRGEIGVVLINHSKVPFHIEKGMRIAQMVITKVEKAFFTFATKMSHTSRGEGGFGSTGQ